MTARAYARLFGVEALRFVSGEFVGDVGAKDELDQADDAIIDHRDEFALLVLPYPAPAGFLEGPDAAGFDVELVGDGDGPQYPPGSAVVAGLF